MLQEVLGLGGDRAWTAASAFGGGIARYQSVCGALTGAEIALGLYAGKVVDDPKKTGDTVRPLARALLEDFRKQFSAVECRNLIPYKLDDPQGHEDFKKSGVKQRQCHQYVRFTVRKVHSWLEEGKLPAPPASA